MPGINIISDGKIVLTHVVIRQPPTTLCYVAVNVVTAVLRARNDEPCLMKHQVFIDPPHQLIHLPLICILSTHPINKPSEHTLSTNPLNKPYQHTLSTPHIHTTYPHTLSTHNTMAINLVKCACLRICRCKSTWAGDTQHRRGGK